MCLLISQTGNSWIVWYVMGLLNHLLIYSSQHFLCFKMNLSVENTMWDSMKVEQISYDALDGSAGQGTVACKAPVSKESEVAQSCPTLCNPVDWSPPGSSVHGILQARILEWVASSFSRGSSWPRDWTQVPCIAGRRFNLWATREALDL